MRTIRSFLFFISIFLFTNVLSQDTLFLKTGEEVDAYIVEKSDKEIKYKIMNSDDSPIIILKTKKVEKIVFRNGQEMNTIPDLIRMEKRFGINGGLLFGLGIESAFYKIRGDYFITPGLSLELDGLIEIESGAGLALGVKYYFNPYNRKKLKAYSGLSIGRFYETVFIQVPIGINYIGESGFDVKFGVNGLFLPSYFEGYPYAELTLGWRL